MYTVAEAVEFGRQTHPTLHRSRLQGLRRGPAHTRRITGSVMMAAALNMRAPAAVHFYKYEPDTKILSKIFA